MFHHIGKLVTRRPRIVILLMVLFMLVSGGVGGGVIKRLSSGGFEDSHAESVLAADRLSGVFQQKSQNFLLLVTAKDGSVDSAQSAKAAGGIEQELKASDHVENVLSYWSNGQHSPNLKSTDGHQAFILATIDGTADEIAVRVKPLSTKFTVQNDSVTVGVGGLAEINHQFSAQIEKDLKFAEFIAFPITLLILLLVFRSVVAAAIPLLVGVFSIVGSLLVLDILSHFATVSIYALNLTTMMGLGLAIDYSLFIVSRFREQLAHGESTEVAVRHTVLSAGRTVVFSAFTVAVSLASLLVFTQPFLRSFAFAGVAVSLIAAAGSLLLLPAILLLLGKRINALPIGRRVAYERGSRFWHRMAIFVMRRPIFVSVTVITLLLFLGIPFRSIQVGRSDERSLPKTNTARLVQDDIRHNFASRESAALQVVSRSGEGVSDASIQDLSLALSRIEGVDHIESASGVYAHGVKVPGALVPNRYTVAGEGTWLSVVPTVEPFSKAGEKLTNDLRATHGAFGFYVGGQSASLVDLKTSLFARLPWALLSICITTFVLLFMMFGSILVPIKALIINFMSLSATFGTMVWIFQDGHLSGLLNFTATGVIEATMPILMFCVAFGLSMDYEVFLLSRIKERYDRTRNNRDAVAHGLEKTGGIVTAAAVSISVVFLAFGTSGVMIIKLFGLGLAFAVLLDAFVIRGTLVPAFMRLAGAANWWAPKPLRRFYRRYGISEID